MEGADARGTDAEFLSREDAPMAWAAGYNAAKDIVVTSDMITCLWVFKIK